jgi:hypothetical protein
MLKLMPLVQQKIKDEMKSVKFAIAMDGSTNASIHYIADFAVFIGVSTKFMGLCVCMHMYLPSLLIERRKYSRGSFRMFAHG